MNELDFFLIENEEPIEQTFELEHYQKNKSISTKDIFEAHFYNNTTSNEFEITPESHTILDSEIQKLVKSLRA